MQSREDDHLTLSAQRLIPLLPPRRLVRNLYFPSPPAERGEMPQAEGGSTRALTR